MSPRLALKGPVLVALAALAAGGVALSQLEAIGLPGGIVTANVRVITTDRALVRAGPLAVERVLVRAGQRVTAGEVVATVDSAPVDADIIRLRSHSADVQRQLDAVRLEAQSIGILHAQGLVQRERVGELDNRRTALEEASAGLVDQITIAEERLVSAIVRAPFSGVVTKVLADPEQGSKPGSDIVEIEADPDRILLEGHLPEGLVMAVRPSGVVRLSFGARDFLEARPLLAHMTSVTFVDAAGARPGTARHALVRFEAELPRSVLAGQGRLHPGTVLRVAAPLEPTTLQQVMRDAIAEPIRRGFNRLSKLVSPKATT